MQGGNVAYGSWSTLLKEIGNNSCFWISPEKRLQW
jgi:hypothetical protein